MRILRWGIPGILLIVVIFFIYPRANDYINIKKIEKYNEETIKLIDEEDIIKKKETPKNTEEIIIKKEEKPENIEEIVIEKEKQKEEPPKQIEEKDQEKETQAKAYIEVPFICQAPLQTEKNWTLHEESCEEAAILQAYLYETGSTMTKAEANIEILDMIDWQNENLGGHFDLYADELKSFIVQYYGINENELIIIYDAKIEDIKEIISSGHPVVVPVTAKYLSNPYYPHPDYHMLTVIGYTEDRIITNDNGTRRGKDFSYTNEEFEKAMNDSGADILYFQLDN